MQYLYVEQLAVLLLSGRPWIQFPVRKPGIVTEEFRNFSGSHH
jgi:hypothetical protein